MKIGALFGVHEEYVYFDEEGAEMTVIDPGPEVPPPVWDSRPISGERCMAATKALCG